MDRRGPVAGADRQPLDDDALLEVIADCFELTDDYATWQALMEAGELEEAFKVVQRYMVT